MTVFIAVRGKWDKALFYSTELFNQHEGLFTKMTLFGRAHHFGANGYLYTDLENMTTALDIVDRVLVEVK